MSFRNYYDTSSYGRRSGDSGRVGSSGGGSGASDRPTGVTAKYITPSYKSSSIPVLCRDRSGTRENETPIAAIASRYANYKPSKDEKAKYDERKDASYNRLTVPGSSSSKSREPSPVSTSSKYSLSRTSRAISPDRRILKTPTLIKSRSRDPSPKEKEKDIPNKTDKSSGYGSGYSSYKIYPRASSYTRPISRTETKPEINLSRYGISNRLSSNYLRGSPIDKSPTSSISPVQFSSAVETDNASIASKETNEEINAVNTIEEKDEEDNDDVEERFETVTVITRHTSPTPPGSSVYVRTRRADMAKTIEKNITRSNKRPPMVDKYMQSDRLDDSTRNSRYGSTTRASVSSWSAYNPSSNKYCGYAGRYSTQYANIREPSVSSNSANERSENHITDNDINVKTNNYKDKSNVGSHASTQQASAMDLKTFVPKAVDHKSMNNENNNGVLTVYKENEDDETSEIIINVNLKLKKSKVPNSVTSTEMVSPEVTITNSQLPPQAPKTEATVKIKKTKIKKSGSDSSNEQKKKIIKKRRGSASSTESDQCTDRNSSENASPVKEIANRTLPNSGSVNIIPNDSSSNVSNKSRHSIKSQTSRDSNSPDSPGISTQTSCSDEEVGSKSKSTRSNDLSRTSADDLSIPLDKSAKCSPSPNQKVEPTTTDEAKSFLIRALGPVTNFFKLRSHDNSENSNWVESSSEPTSKDAPNLSTESEHTNINNKSAATGYEQENKITLRPIRHIESGERAWWMDSEHNEKSVSAHQNSGSDRKLPPRKIRHIESGERAWWLESSNDNAPSDNNGSSEPSRKQINSKYSNHDSEEKPWWLDSSANIPEGIERLSPVRKTSSESEKSEKFDFYKLRHIDSGEKEWWHTSNSENVTHSSANEKFNDNSHLSKSASDSKSNFPLKKIHHVMSGERPWWLSSSKNVPEGIEKLPTPSPPSESDSSMSDEVEECALPNKQIPPFPLTLPDDEPLGDRRSPEGLENPREAESYRHRRSPYENTNYANAMSQPGYRKSSGKFVSRYTDIDDIFGTSGQMYSPFMDSILARRMGQATQEDDFSDCEEIDPTQVRIHDSTPQHPVIKKLRCRSEIIDCRDEDQLDEVALQVYKNNDYGVYLELDSTIGEQQEELEGIREKRRNAIVLRTQLSVRVHSIIERLREAEGRELRKALFSLKQVLQRDKDLVHEFVENEGLDCLMSVGASDPNYLEYVLRALGQIVLYVDGMHGVMHHKTCIQWLYTLTTNPFRHIVKNCLKLLMVFVEYNDMNCTLLINAVHAVDKAEGGQPWQNIMKILKDFDASDTELLIYAMTLINRCLNNAVDKDVYYDQVDALEDQGLDDIIKLYMSKQGTDLDLLRQFQIYEAVLSYEDGDDTGTALKQLDDSVINVVRRRSNIGTGHMQRRKSKKQMLKDENDNVNTQTDQKSSNEVNLNVNTQFMSPLKDNQENQEKEKALRRRRERFARQSHHIIQQHELFNNGTKLNKTFTNGIRNKEFNNTGDEHEGSIHGLNEIHSTNGVHTINGDLTGNGAKTSNDALVSNGAHTKINIPNSNRGYINSKGVHKSNGSATTYHGLTTSNGLHEQDDDGSSSISRTMRNLNIADVLVHGTQRYTAGLKQRIQNGTLGHSVSAIDALMVMRKKNESKDFQEKDHALRPSEIDEAPTRVAEMTGLLLKAKEGLAKSQSKDIIKSSPVTPKSQVSENEAQWEELRKGLNRAYHICDLDFSDLIRDSADEVSVTSAMGNGVPPPPLPPPPLGMYNMSMAAPPPPPTGCIPPIKPTLTNSSNASTSSTSYDDGSIKKNKKTVKLFWKEVTEFPLPPNLKQKVGSIWDDLPDVNVDTKMLEHLFESRSNDLLIKKLQEPKKTFILDTKRSNAINIGMKKLPTPQAIKAAIMKMDATVIGREGIEKLLTMLPTEEEKIKIQEAQYANPDLPLGNAEQFLLALASITELSCRLKLWLFKLDFENAEKEIAEPLMDLKQGIELLKVNITFKAILSTLRSVGSFLNGTQVKGFRLEYLSKVMEVKDTVHKHPLLYHICEMIIQKFPESSDFFSEVGPVIRASKVDFDALKQNLVKLESDCKSSWDHLKKVAKHDGPMIIKTRINEFLTDAAERIILLGIIEKKVLNRFNQFLLYIGVPFGEIINTKPSAFLKILSEFALEYMTSRERVLQQLEKKANHRERNKTRGKLIIDSGNYSNKNGDIAADAALRELLMTDAEDSSAMGRKKMPHKSTAHSDLQTPDEIFESLVKSSMNSRRKPRERKRARLVDKLSLDRSIDMN